MGSSQRPVDSDIQGKAYIAVMSVADREALGMKSPHGVSVLSPKLIGALLSVMGLMVLS